MPKDIDTVEIKDPPLQELNKKRSCLIRTCFTGCGCIVLFGAGFFLLIRYATTPRVRMLKTAPETLVQAVPIYDIGNAETIKFTGGKDRSRALERAAYLPKILLSPLLALVQKSATSTTGRGEQVFDWSALEQIIKTPITDQRDLYQIEWRDLPAAPTFIESWYGAELGKRNFSVQPGTRADSSGQIFFSKGGLDGAVLWHYDEKLEGTKFILLTVTLPAPGQ